jgi:biopolymer transport protein ExbD
MHAQRNDSFESSINVTPLVDVCLVLLIIFMVVIPVMVTGVPVQLPKTKSAGPVSDANRQLPITVKDDGTVFLDATVVRREQVRSELERLHAQSPQRPVAVRGDKRVPYGQVVDVLDACRSAGYENVGLISQTVSEGKRK